MPEYVMNFIRQTPKRLLYLMLGAYWTLIFALTHTPSTTKLPSPQNDKLAHFIAYMGLAFLLGCVVLLKRRPLFTSFTIVMTVSLVYAITDEATQLLVAGRTAELWDVVADMLGAAGGWVASCLVVFLLGKVYCKPAKAQLSE